MSGWGIKVIIRVCGKKFFLGAGCGVWGVGRGVWGFTSFEVANYLIFREKVPKFPPDHSHIQYFLIDKRSKSLTQQGF
ncbi:hypothetical protein [Microcystis aeruginosa]|uniref:hypothetical protein n=1 Tax=Microcystis aeruginosa TaxID=1126 RepID=UPI00130545D9|nr:hypothetical protein [Microcystis aeruginosa]